MKSIYKIVTLSIITFIFSLGMSFADSNIDENNNTEEMNNLKNEMTELEELILARQAAVSQQLSRLRQEGLVIPRRDGKTIYYRLSSAKR